MDTLICMECSSNSAARGFVEDAGSGSLWGVSLGTTSRCVAVGPFLVIGCTPTRAENIMESAPGGGSQWKSVDNTPGVTQMPHDQAIFFGYGQMDE